MLAIYLHNQRPEMTGKGGEVEGKSRVAREEVEWRRGKWVAKIGSLHSRYDSVMVFLSGRKMIFVFSLLT